MLVDLTLHALGYPEVNKSLVIKPSLAVVRVRSVQS